MKGIYKNGIIKTITLKSTEEYRYLSFRFYFDLFSDSNFARLRCVIDEKAIENDTLRRRLTDAHEQAKKTVDKDLAKNIVLKYLSLPGMSQKCVPKRSHSIFIGFQEL